MEAMENSKEVWFNGDSYVHTPALVLKVLPDGSAKVQTPDNKQHHIPKIESSMEVDSKSQDGVADILQVPGFERGRFACA